MGMQLQFRSQNYCEVHEFRNEGLLLEVSPTIRKFPVRSTAARFQRCSHNHVLQHAYMIEVSHRIVKAR